MHVFMLFIYKLCNFYASFILRLCAQCMQILRESWLLSLARGGLLSNYSIPYFTMVLELAGTIGIMSD